MFFQQLGAWFLSLLMVFGIGVSAGREGEPEEISPELKQKITAHMDVIVDELAGMADDISEEVSKRVDEFRDSDFVKSLEEYVDNIQKILEDLKKDIEERFDIEEPEYLKSDFGEGELEVLIEPEEAETPEDPASDDMIEPEEPDEEADELPEAEEEEELPEAEEEELPEADGGDEAPEAEAEGDPG